MPHCCKVLVSCGRASASPHCPDLLYTEGFNSRVGAMLVIPPEESSGHTKATCITCITKRQDSADAVLDDAITGFISQAEYITLRTRPPPPSRASVSEEFTHEACAPSSE